MTKKLKRMDHIEVFTGLKRRKDKKMGLSKVKSGNSQAGILGTGEIMEKKDLELCSSQMEINMKECGIQIKDMGKELTGELREESLGENTLGIGLKIKNMEEELFSLKMETDMMDIGLTIRCKVKEE